MLTDALKAQLRTHLANIRQPVALVASLDASPKAQEMQQLLQDIAALSPQLTLRTDGDAARRPSFRIASVDRDAAIEFAAIPLGHELSSLLLALLQVGGHPPRISEAEADAIRSIRGRHHFETYISLSCQNCPETVQALNIMATLNPAISHSVVDGALFRAEVEELGILSVPTVRLNGADFAQGRLDVAALLELLGKDDAEARRAQIDALPQFDVLVVGAGPAGAAAAVYAARKGIPTGIVAERFGGQVLDTGAIENFISVAHTEGPQLAAAMEAHVRGHDIDVVAGERATRLVPAEQSASGLVEVELANGATLRARSVVLSPGANWRQLGVPGEAEYRTRGVAYCPHCDGPLFRGRAVAVIGGGNSGVEAAIDLAGIASRVTLIEFDRQLRADAVLVRKAQTLANVEIITNAETTAIEGDGARVTGLVCRDRDSGTSRRIAVDGVFIQIGLQPNTGWLQGTVALNRHGEIEIGARGETSVAGVYAAGDATTTPFKQIVVALGSGATAALGAFDHLIRAETPAAIAA